MNYARVLAVKAEEWGGVDPYSFRLVVGQASWNIPRYLLRRINGIWQGGNFSIQGMSGSLRSIDVRYDESAKYQKFRHQFQRTNSSAVNLGLGYDVPYLPQAARLLW